MTETIFEQLEITLEKFTEVIDRNPSLRGIEIFRISSGIEAQKTVVVR